MKKISILALCVLGLSLCANSANFGGKKFYINPGHGGHDSDDRPTALPLNVPMFYESDGNLDLSLGRASYEQLSRLSYRVLVPRLSSGSASHEEYRLQQSVGLANRSSIPSKPRR